MQLRFVIYCLLLFCVRPKTVLSAMRRDPSEPSVRSQVESFKVMDVMRGAIELESQGRHIVHMEVGQPSTGAPKKVLDAAREALEKDRLGYTNALGMDSLRKAISHHYLKKYGVHVDEERVVITTGSSAAFLFAFLGCFDAGAHIALCSTGYPCYRNDMKATGLEFCSIPVNVEYKVTALELKKEVMRRAEVGLPPLAGFICSSPSNPTGSMLSTEELKDICNLCEEEGITFISDEIYHGISYGKTASTAAQFSDKALVINSFSKYYSMTGWRLGWMVVPHSLVDTMNRLSQNLYINAPTLSQFAACGAFDCDEELNQHVARYAANREIVLKTLEELGLLGGAAPADGAFYVYVDLAAHGVTDAPALCTRLLREAGVAITPGVDFEDPASGLGLQRIRFSYSRSTEDIKNGMARFKEWWLREMKK